MGATHTGLIVKLMVKFHDFGIIDEGFSQKPTAKNAAIIKGNNRAIIGLGSIGFIEILLAGFTAKFAITLSIIPLGAFLYNPFSTIFLMLLSSTTSKLVHLILLLIIHLTDCTFLLLHGAALL